MTRNDKILHYRGLN
ncbi:hypothetical protein [Escherichia coli]|nr:hypothetical protein [Escherichia coli]